MIKCRSIRRKRDVSQSIKIVPPEELADLAKEVHSLVAKRAYEIYKSRDSINDHDIEDWRQAESEVVCRVAVGFMPSLESLTVDAGVAGFGPEDLRISIEPFRLIISGKRNINPEEAAEARTPGPLHLLKVIDLPVEVIPRLHVVRLSNGLLELILPKAAQAQRGSKAA